MYTPINIDTYNLDKSSTRVNFFIFSQVFATGTAIPSKGSSTRTSPKGCMNEDFIAPAHQEELRLCNKDKAFSITQKPQGLAAYYRNTAEQSLLGEKKAKCAKLLNCLVDLKLCWHPHTVA